MVARIGARRNLVEGADSFAFAVDDLGRPWGTFFGPQVEGGLPAWHGASTATHSPDGIVRTVPVGKWVTLTAIPSGKGEHELSAPIRDLRIREMPMANPLDGPGQITAIAVVFALIAYLRNVPMKRLEDYSNEKFDEEKAGRKAGKENKSANELKNNLFQSQEDAYGRLIWHCRAQIGLMILIVLLALHIGWSIWTYYATAGGDFLRWLDTFLGSITAIAAIGLLIAHWLTDGGEIKKTRATRKEFRNNSPASVPPEKPHTGNGAPAQVEDAGLSDPRIGGAADLERRMFPTLSSRYDSP